jgi:hypothetical protein
MRLGLLVVALACALLALALAGWLVQGVQRSARLA